MFLLFPGNQKKLQHVVGRDGAGYLGSAGRQGKHYEKGAAAAFLLCLAGDNGVSKRKRMKDDRDGENIHTRVVGWVSTTSFYSTVSDRFNATTLTMNNTNLLPPQKM